MKFLAQEARRFLFKSTFRHGGGGRNFPLKPLSKARRGFGLALKKRFHPLIRISHPAAQPFLRSQAIDERAETHPLHHAAYADAVGY
jgi:hypothetical protein